VVRRPLAALTIRPAPVARLAEVRSTRTGSFRGHVRSTVAAERAFRRRWHARHFASSLLLPAKPEPSGWHSEPRPLTGRLHSTHFHLVFSRCLRPAHAAAGGDVAPGSGGMPKAGRRRWRWRWPCRSTPDGSAGWRGGRWSQWTDPAGRGSTPRGFLDGEVQWVASSGSFVARRIRSADVAHSNPTGKGRPDAIRRTRGIGLGRPPRRTGWPVVHCTFPTPARGARVSSVGGGSRPGDRRSALRGPL